MNTRRVLLLVGVIGLILFGWLFWDDLAAAAEILRGVSWPILLLVIPVQAWSYFSNAMFYRTAIAAISDSRPPIGKLYGLSIGVAFTNIILPSAGASGVSLMAAALRRDKVSTGQTAFIQIAHYATVYATFVLLLLFALGSLYFGDDIARIAIRIVVLVITAVIAVSIVAGYVIYDKRGFNWLVMNTQRFVDWVAGHFRRGRDLIGHERAQRLLKEFHNGVQQVVRDRAYLRQPTWWALSGNIAEVLTVYLVFVALGFVINPGIIIIAYAVANAAGILTIIPGDIGVYELAMVSILSIVGVPLAVGVSATLLYRVVNKVLIIPFGFYFYNRYIRQATDAAHH